MMDFEDFIQQITGKDLNDVVYSYIWKDLLKYIHDELEPLFESDFAEHEEELSYIQEKADLNTTTPAGLITLAEKGFWNESVNSLINRYKDYFYKEEDEKKKINNWLRLLMPKNSRRVEVEDLNRNFWVISSVLAGVSSYLFDDNAPLGGTLKGILNELVQLWSNILFLWTELAFLAQKKVDKVKVLIIPTPSSSLQPYKKYDNFDNVETIDSIREKIAFLKSQYSNTHLCILPYIRKGNYYRNYYTEEVFPYACLYNAITEKMSLIPLQISGGGSVSFKTENYKDRLYAIRETDIYYKWSYPISSINTLQDDITEKRYYAGIRIIPEIDVSVNKDGLLEVSALKLTGIDAARKALVNETYDVLTYELQNPFNEESQAAVVSKAVGEKDIDGVFDIYEAALDEALYFGEMPTWSNISLDKPVYTVLDENKIVGNGILLKVGNFLPKQAADYLDTNLISAQSAPPQSNSFVLPTAYEANLTIKGTSDQVSMLEEWYGAGLGAGNVVSPGNSYYYITQFKDGAPVYSSEIINDFSDDYTIENGYQPNTAITLDFLRRNGWDVVKNYIINTNFELNSIAYFMTAVGIRPWHNTAPNLTSGVFQGYWTHNLLTHLFRFVPIDYAEVISTSNAEKVSKDGVFVGYVEYLGEINRTEHSFQNVFHLAYNTTWRLPKLIPEQAVSAFLAIEVNSKKGLETKYLDISENSELQEAYANKDYDTIVSYITLHPTELKDEEELKIEYFEHPSGVWTMFDGNVSKNNMPSSVVGNMEQYDTENNFRQAVHMDFSFTLSDTIQWSVDNTRVRAWNSSTYNNLASYPVDNTQVEDIWSSNYILQGTGYYTDWT